MLNEHIALVKRTCGWARDRPSLALPIRRSMSRSFGEQIAWSESNAVAFANSVIGARTNRYGDYLDICCALTGRAPAAGLHLDEPRLATVVVELELGSVDLAIRDDFYPVLGYLLGSMCPTRYRW